MTPKNRNWYLKIKRSIQNSNKINEEFTSSQTTTEEAIRLAGLPPKRKKN